MEKEMSHREILSNHKLRMLRKAAQEIERTGVNEVSIRIFKDDISDFCNWQKCRYNALIFKVEKNGIIQRGLWGITRQGWEFLEGKKELPRWVEIEDNHIVNKSEETIGVRDVYHGSEAVITTFNYSDGDREWVAPIAQPDLQISLLTEDVQTKYPIRNSIHA